MIRVCHNVIEAVSFLPHEVEATSNRATFIELLTSDGTVCEEEVQDSSEYDEDMYAEPKFVGRTRNISLLGKKDFYEPSKYHRSARTESWKRHRQTKYRACETEKSIITGCVPVLMDGYWEDGRFFPYFE